MIANNDDNDDDDDDDKQCNHWHNETNTRILETS